MGEPKIQWYVKDKTDEEYIPKREYFAGGYNPEKEIEFDIRIWNNRYNNESVENIENPLVNIYFESLEDSILLEYCKVGIENAEPSKVNITDNKGSVYIGRAIEGRANDGEYDNYNNYVDIKIVFDLSEINVKNHDLKNMYLEVLEI